jgi:hypothetical protein
MGGDFATTIYPQRRVRRASPRHPMCHTLHSFTSFTASISFTSCCFRTLLSFFVSTENSTLLFSGDSALFAKNHRGWGEVESISSGPVSTIALSPLAATLMGLPASVANKRLTAPANSFSCNTYKKQGAPEASYSILSAFMGEMDAARFAGMMAAMKEQIANAPAATVSASGSHEVTPYS